MKFIKLSKELKKILDKPNPRTQDIILRIIQNLSDKEKEKYSNHYFTLYRLSKSKQKPIGEYL